MTNDEVEDPDPDFICLRPRPRIIFADFSVPRREYERDDVLEGPMELQSSRTTSLGNIDKKRASRSKFTRMLKLYSKTKGDSSRSQTSVVQVLSRESLEPPQHSAFLSLPEDVHYMLAAQYLDFETVIALRQTCRKLHSLLTSSIVRRIRSVAVSSYLQDEEHQYSKYRTMYPRQRISHVWELMNAAFDFRLVEQPSKELRCYGCLELKPMWEFVERMSNRGTGLGAKHASDRMCKSCMRRYRDIEGQWWRENWVKKSDTVRKASAPTRVGKFLFRGESLLNPAEEVGVCACCGSGVHELWWGCVDCFERDSKKRRETDRRLYNGGKRELGDVWATLKYHHTAGKRRRQARERRTGAWYAWWPGTPQDRREALIEYFGNQNPHDCPPYLPFTRAFMATKTAPWRALDDLPLPKSNREARCSECWTPNVPRRLYLGMAYETPLPVEHWCDGCRLDFNARHSRRREKQKRERASCGNDKEEWWDGFAELFNESEDEI